MRTADSCVQPIMYNIKLCTGKPPLPHNPFGHIYANAQACAAYYGPPALFSEPADQPLEGRAQQIRTRLYISRGARSRPLPATRAEAL